MFARDASGGRSNKVARRAVMYQKHLVAVNSYIGFWGNSASFGATSIIEAKPPR